MTQPVSEVLYRAADLIEERGWAHGDGWGGDGPLCLEGGIAAAMGTDFLSASECPAYHAVRSYVGVAPHELFIWNDRLLYVSVGGPYIGGSLPAAEHAARERVIAVLRAAALIEAAKENAETREPVTS